MNTIYLDYCLVGEIIFPSESLTLLVDQYCGTEAITLHVAQLSLAWLLRREDLYNLFAGTNMLAKAEAPKLCSLIHCVNPRCCKHCFKEGVAEARVLVWGRGCAQEGWEEHPHLGSWRVPVFCSGTQEHTWCSQGHPLLLLPPSVTLARAGLNLQVWIVALCYPY